MSAKNTQNPLLETQALPQGAPPFDRIRDEHFAPAFEAALTEARANLDAIRNATDEPTFPNTIEALEMASETLDRVNGIFSFLLHGHTNDTLQKLALEIMPKLADFSNDISLDDKIFVRVKAVWDTRAQIGKKMNLDQERLRLLEKTYQYFTRNGALLAPDAKEKLRAVDNRLAVLGQQFGDNVLKETNAFEMRFTQRAELAGLPGPAIEAAAQAARDRHPKETAESWVITLQAPSFLPFMKFSERRDLREKLWKAYMTRATSGTYDNRGVLLEITRLRHERAALLGYASHAHFTLEERMAADPVKVRTFLERIGQGALPAAKQDVDDLRAISGLKDFRPWDFAFWSERLRKQRFGFDEESVRPYFSLENVVNGVFEHARRLYGLHFTEKKDLPVYQPDVRVYAVTMEAAGRDTGEHVGLLYTDFFPRASKQGGAWMSSLRDQGLYAGQVERPVVGVTCNLAPPSADRPSLLNLEEVRTIFHEFGHALHSLLSRVRYRSLAGTNVWWDFVELPSQIMENWVYEEESLALFARHYQTNAPMPATLIQQVRDSARFQAGYQTMRQLSFGLLDMAWHSQDPSSLRDVEGYERSVLDPLALFEPVPGAIISPGFSHIFAGGYSAGYYSYKWAEVLDADAFEFFREKGLFNREVSERFRKFILERGGTEHPMELYKKFRGREPDPDALLRRDGLIKRA